MSKLLKITTIVMITSFSQLALAAYQVALPLEVDSGGALPNGSLNFGDSDNDNETPTTPSNNCLYDNKNYIILVTEAQPDRYYEVGDMIFVADEKVISYYSPANNKFPKPGISRGKEMESYQDETYFEICGDNLSNYPIMGGVDQEEENTPPDDHTGPDWTPQCILNTSSDYSAIDTLNGGYKFNSSSFGLINYTSPRWYYVPDNYDSNNPSSYIYFDNSENTGSPRVSGPNPNYTYSEICRVRKMEL